jgi:hypothetical protein
LEHLRVYGWQPEFKRPRLALAGGLWLRDTEKETTRHRIASFERLVVLEDDLVGNRVHNLLLHLKQRRASPSRRSVISRSKH